MAEGLFKYVELSAQLRPSRAYELLKQIQPSADETVRWLGLAIRLSKKAGCDVETVQQHVRALVEKARGDRGAKEHCLRNAGKLRPLVETIQNLDATHLGWLSHPGPDLPPVPTSSKTEQSPTKTEQSPPKTSTVENRRVLGLVWLRSQDDAQRWNNILLHTWKKLGCPFVALTADVKTEGGGWLRVVEVGSAGDATSATDSLLRLLQADSELSQFDSYLILTPDTALLGDRLPLLMTKSTAGGGEAEKPMVVGHSITTTHGRTLRPPYFFNRSSLVKLANKFSVASTLPANATVDRRLMRAADECALPSSDWHQSLFGCDGNLTRGDAKQQLLRSAAGPLVVSGLKDAADLQSWQIDHKMASEVERAGQWAAGRTMTIVTGLFDIRGRELDERPRESKSAADFVELGRPLLEWNCNLYVVTEPKFATHIRQMREELGFKDKTVVEAVGLEETDYYGCIERIYQLFATGRVPERFWPPKDTALYVWCMWQKYDCLRRALSKNPFNSASMYWLDIGIYHVATQPPSLPVFLAQLAANRRLRCTLLRTISPLETTNREQFFSKLQQAVGGGVIGGPIEQVRWLRDEFDKEARLSLRHFPVLDEALLGAIVTTHPHRFFPIYSGHREMLLPRDHQLIFDQMIVAAAKGGRVEMERALDLAAELNPLPLSMSERNTANQLVEALRSKLTERRSLVGRKLRVGLCDGGHWFKQTLVSALRKFTGAQLDGSDDTKLLPTIEWVLKPDSNVDVLLFSQHGNDHERFKGCSRKLCVTGEMNWPGSPEPYPCDVMITGVPNPNTVFVPFHVTSFWERRWHSLQHLTHKPKTAPTSVQKPRFCAFFYHNCVPAREAFFDLLSITYRPVDALGKSRNSNRSYHSVDRHRDVPGSTLYDSATVKYLPYRFVVAFEPFVQKGWITEKVVNPMLAGAIPIYRGAPDIAEFFNTQAFVDGNGKTDDEVIAIVRDLDQHPDKLQQLWAQPWLTEQQLQTWFTQPLHPKLEQLLHTLLPK